MFLAPRKLKRIQYSCPSFIIFHICTMAILADCTVSITLSNWYGYLDAADYPAMVFYSLLLVVYVFLAVVWSVLLYCSYSNLIRLQVCVRVHACIVWYASGHCTLQQDKLYWNVTDKCGPLTECVQCFCV